MDTNETYELSKQFGRLSTNAAEWTPHTSSVGSSATSTSVSSSFGYSQQQQQQQSHQQQQQQHQYQSDLNPSRVKEFVPGKGWASSSGATTSTGVPKKDGPAMHQYAYSNNDQRNEQLHASSETLSEAESSRPVTLPSGPVPSPLPSFRAIHSLGVADETWNYYRDLSLEGLRQMEPTDERHKEVLPPFTNAYCLDDQPSGLKQERRKRSSFFGYPGRTFQVTNRQDGHLYCLHRFDDAVRSVSPKIAQTVTEKWNAVPEIQEHPNIVPFYRCFVAQRAVFFVHQYIPAARTLQERTQGQPVLQEQILWSCLTQLVSVLRQVHQANLAIQTIDLKHVLSTTDAVGSRLRLRCNCVGIVDALEFEARRSVVELQRQDIRDLGWLLLSLATGTELNGRRSSVDASTVAQCESFLAQNFSREWHNLVLTLLKSTPHPPSITDLARAVAQHALDEQDNAYKACDWMERCLSTEYESGRCFRLLVKMGCINERPEFGQDRQWSQSGDCYVLTLFRDYVFHQADGSGYPVLDLGHIMTCLNKLDTASEEKIVLASRDGKSLMVVTYADVARCLEQAYGELCSIAVRPSTLLFS